MAAKKVKEQIGAELIRHMELKDRYYSVDNLLLDIFVITNPSTKRVKYDLILSTVVLEQLKIVLSIIDEDLKMKPEDIDLIDLFGDMDKETSRFIHDNCSLSYINFKRDYEELKKAKELDSKISEDERIKRIRELKKEIDSANAYIEMLGKGNFDVKGSYEVKIFNLERECSVIEETLNYKSYEEIQEEIYIFIYNRVVNLHNRVFDKIEFLDGELIKNHGK